MIKNMKNLIRSATDLDKETLPVYSFSKLELFDQCNYKYKIKYIDEIRAVDSSLVLDLGSIAHKGYELKYRSILEGKEPDYDFIINALQNGIEEETEKDTRFVNGFIQIRDTYGIVPFGVKCDKSGMNYMDKIKLYFDNLMTETITENWHVIAVEKPFTFVYDNMCIIHGFIDRIDENENGDVRIIDYKTSKAVFSAEKIRTPLQMIIYALASFEMYNKIPIEFMYDFIFINEKQYVNTKKLLEKGIVKLDKILENLKICLESTEYVPNPTPLCYWCDFCQNTPLSGAKTKYICDYYSLWSPSRRTFAKNKEYEFGGCNKKINNNPFKI